MLFSERRLSHRESNKGSKETQEQTISVRFTEVPVKRESTVTTIVLFVCFVFVFI